MEYLTIHCSECGQEWDYKGKKLKLIEEGKRVYVSCPTCHKNIKIKDIGE